MFQFTDSSRVSVPATGLFRGKFVVSVRVQPGDNLQSLREFYQERLKEFEITGKVVTDLKFLQSLTGTPVRLLGTDVDFFRTSALVMALSFLRPVVVLEPEENLLRKINLLTSFDMAVRIDLAVRPKTDGILERALDFYLHNPMLTVPIQPFHSLLIIIGRGLGRTLWDIGGENVACHFFVNDAGEVSLSRRWLAQGLSYGRIDDPAGNLETADLFRKLTSFRHALLQSGSSCISCPHLDLCGGFLRAIETDWPCDSWQRVFTTLRQESKHARNLLKEIEIMNQKEAVGKNEEQVI